MALYTFKHENYDTDHNITMTFSDEEDETWGHVCTQFVYFLRSIGFIFNEATVKEFLGDAINDIKEAEESIVEPVHDES